MKDTIISVRRKKTELKWLAGSLIIAIILNVYAIAHFHTAWKELYTMIPTLIILAIVIYVIMVLFRLIIQGIFRLTAKK